MNRIFRFAFLLPLVLLATAEVRAQDLVTDRPDFTESTGIVPRGHVQFETGFGRQSGDGFRDYQLLQTLARIGVDRALELRLGWLGYSSIIDDVREDSKGSGDLTVGAKVALPFDGRIQAAILGTVIVPSGSDEFRSDDLTPEVRLALSGALADAWSLGANFGAEFANQTVALYSLVLAHAFTQRTGAVLELYGYEGDGISSQFVDTALTFLFRPNVQFDLIAGIPLSDEAIDWFGGFGVSFRIPR